MPRAAHLTQHVIGQHHSTFQFNAPPKNTKLSICTAARTQVTAQLTQTQIGACQGLHVIMISAQLQFLH